MEEPIFSKEEFEGLRSISGEARGIAIKGEVDFILEQEGDEGVEKLEKKINDMGYPIKLKEIKTMDFYPVWLEALVLCGAEKLFHYDTKKFQEMGRFEPKVSFLIRMFMKYFFSPEIVAREAPKIWRESYTVGDLEVVKFDQENREAVVRLKNFKLHPLQCQNLIGYFASVVQMITGKPVTCREEKCVFRGDEYHEFVLNW